MPGTLRRIGALLALLPGLALVSCSGDDATAPATPLARLQLGRQRWAEAGLDRYDFRLERRCFCLPTYALPLGIRVRDGQVVEVWRDPAHAHVDPFYGETIPGLFARIERAMTAGYETIDVRYNERFGYPEEIELDKVGIADEEFGATVTLLCRESAEDAGPACDCAEGEGTAAFDLVLHDRAGNVLSQGCLSLAFGATDRPGFREAVGGRRCLRALCGADLPDAFAGDFTVVGQVDTLGNLTADITRGQFIENVSIRAGLSGEGGGRSDFSGEWLYRHEGSVMMTGPFTARLRASSAARRLDGPGGP